MNIIDIRSRDEYLLGHIGGSINIDKNSLLSNPSNYLEKDKVYHICCTSGITSRRIVSILNEMGYNTVNIDGGYNNLKSSN